MAQRVSSNSPITTSFRPQTLSDGSPEAQLKSFSRFAGRVLVFLSLVCFMFSGYVGFAHYWILTHWIKTEGTVQSGEIRQGSSGAGGIREYSSSYLYRCTVSYSVSGKTVDSQLDLPSSAYRIDAQGWGGTFSPGRSIEILYDSSNPRRILLANNPAEVTLVGSLRFGFYLLVPGLLLLFLSRARQEPYSREN